MRSRQIEILEEDEPSLIHVESSNVDKITGFRHDDDENLVLKPSHVGKATIITGNGLDVGEVSEAISFETLF